MAILDILQYPDPRLHLPAARVEKIDAGTRRLVADMAETMYAADGIGLAATQVNVHLQIVLIDVSPDRNDLRVFINPEITRREGLALNQEGCLSVPGIYTIVSPGNKDAEDRFKELAGAFAVLSDPEKRAQYDQAGHAAFGADFDPFAGVRSGEGDFGFGDLADLFGMFGGGPRRRGRRRGGEDLQMEIRIPFVDAVTGTTVSVTLPRRVACPECGGSGPAASTGEGPCTDCGGTGRRSQKRRQVRIETTCSSCGGSGRAGAIACRTCGGDGRAAADERVTVSIPPGIDDGGRVRLPRKGNASPDGGSTGDAYLHVRVEPHPLFRVPPDAPRLPTHGR